MRLAIVMLVLGMSATAHAEIVGVIQIRRQTNAGRWEIGASASSGPRTLGNFDVRRHLSDRLSLTARTRFDREAPRAADLTLSYAFAYGKLLLPGDALARIDLVIDAGGGVVRDAEPSPTGFAGVGLRIQPRSADWMTVELGVRETWAREVPSTIARATGPIERAYGRATELMLRWSVMWPGPRYECVYR